MDTAVRSRSWLLGRSLAGTALAGMAALGIAHSPAQARAWAEREPQPEVAPWADRAARLPGRAGERFAMRESPSVARALGKIGELFGGPGYDPDPCPRRRENVAALVAAGDSAALRHEVDFARRNCRP